MLTSDAVHTLTLFRILVHRRHWRGLQHCRGRGGAACNSATGVDPHVGVTYTSRMEWSFVGTPRECLPHIKCSTQARPHPPVGRQRPPREFLNIERGNKIRYSSYNIWFIFFIPLEILVSPSLLSCNTGIAEPPPWVVILVAPMLPVLFFQPFVLWLGPHGWASHGSQYPMREVWAAHMKSSPLSRQCCRLCHGRVSYRRRWGTGLVCVHCVDY